MYLKMHMTTGSASGVAGVSDKPDNLALGYLLSLSDHIFRVMRINRLGAVGVVDYDIFAEASVPAGIAND